MATLFLDIETVPDLDAETYFEMRRRVDSGELTPETNKSEYWKFQKSALSPFDGKTMLITYKIGAGHVHHLKEWEDGEVAILKTIFGVIDDLQHGPGDGLRIVGHNLVKFDINFLYERMRLHKIAEPAALYKQVLSRPLFADFLQMHLPLNDMSGKGLKHDVLAHAYGLPTKSTRGSEETAHYFACEYDKIIEYSNREFIYPELYAKIDSGGLVSAEELRRSIDWYDSLHAGDDNGASL